VWSGSRVATAELKGPFGALAKRCRKGTEAGASQCDRSVSTPELPSKRIAEPCHTRESAALSAPYLSAARGGRLIRDAPSGKLELVSYGRYSR